MDANQRSELNNQTENGANEKWTPGAKGSTAGGDRPLDHTYPQGAPAQPVGGQDLAGSGTVQTGAGPGGVDGHFDRSDAMRRSDVPGGSMETQINGGSGTVQGITDSHERAMMDKSSAYGKLELPVGQQRNGGGVDVNRQGNLQGGQPGSTQGGGMAGPRSTAAPRQGAGSMGNRQAATGGATQGGGMPGPDAGRRNGQEAQRGNTQLGVSGSHAMANRDGDAGVHQSNDVAGGLPRSPGNAGPRRVADSTDRQGSQTGADAGAVHDSNDAAGGYPRSPGHANRLAGDANMDDDTGFKRKS